jgi:hypothetical protein
MKRKVWIAVFLLLTAAPIGMEIWGAADNSNDTSTWTELISTWWPAPVTLGAIGFLTAWLGPHFLQAYRMRSTTDKAPSWWLRADGANRSWRTIAQGIVATGLIAAGEVVRQVVMDQALNGTPIDWRQVGVRAAMTGGAAVLMAVLAYLHRVKVDPSSVPSALPPDPIPASRPTGSAGPFSAGASAVTAPG